MVRARAEVLFFFYFVFFLTDTKLDEVALDV